MIDFPYTIADFEEAYAATDCIPVADTYYEKRCGRHCACPLVVLAAFRGNIMPSLVHPELIRAVLRLTFSQHGAFMSGFDGDDDNLSKWHDVEPFACKAGVAARRYFLPEVMS